MAKQRTKIPEDTANHARWLSDDTCCICHERGKEIQLHHIDEDPQNHVIKNLAVLCLECHNETQKKGGFTRRLTPSYVTKYRDEWLKTVDFRRKEADKNDIKRRVGEKSSDDQPRDKRQSRLDKRQSRLDFIQESNFEFEVIFIKSLPKFKTELLQQRNEKISGEVTTIDIVEAHREYIDALMSILTKIADFYHPEYFEDLSPKEFFEKIISERYSIYNMASEPYGKGTGGTIRSILSSTFRRKDVENLIEIMVEGLVGISDFDYDDWQQLWRDSEILQ